MSIKKENGLYIATVKQYGIRVASNSRLAAFQMALDVMKERGILGG